MEPEKVWGRTGKKSPRGRKTLKGIDELEIYKIIVSVKNASSYKQYKFNFRVSAVNKSLFSLDSKESEVGSPGQG